MPALLLRRRPIRALLAAALALCLATAGQLVLASTASATPFARVQIGAADRSQGSADYDEFTDFGDTSPVHVVGSGNLATVRPWIGHSTCSGCGSTSQQLSLANLTTGDAYVIAVHPSYLIGAPTYRASVAGGTATIAVGGNHHFAENGYLTRPETWYISFIPATTSVTILLDNDATSGNNYMYIDWYTAAPQTVPVVDDGLTARIGDVDPFASSAAWDEFGSSATNATYTVGSSGLSSMRQWIGHSTCGTCGSATTTQRVTVTGLTTGADYWLTIYPSQVTGSATYSATIGSGTATISSGSSYTPSSGWKTMPDKWTVHFTAGSSSVSIDLGNGLTSGDNYLYFNWIDFSPDAVTTSDLDPSAMTTKAASYDTYNGGDWWASDVSPSAGYRWNQGYVMNSYVELYKMTLDPAWLEKLVEQADEVLSQRDSVTHETDCYGDSPPAWHEDSTGYVWIGFTGAMFLPMMEFAAMVLSSPYLSAQTYSWLGGGTLGARASAYVSDFQDAVDYHESEWTTSGSYGWYKFQNDIATTCGLPGGAPLAGQPAAFDMDSLMMDAELYLSQAYAAAGNATDASTYAGRVGAYSQYFHSSWTYHSTGDYYTWLFATYYGNLDDVGHANFNVKFVADAYQAGLGYSATDVSRIANTFSRLIQPDYSEPYNVHDATYSSTWSDLDNSTYYWNTITPYASGLSDRASGKDRLSLVAQAFQSDGLLSLVGHSYTNFVTDY